MQEYYFLMVWSHYISLDVITLFNFRGIFILVWSSDSLAVSPGLSKTWPKPLKSETNHFALPPLHLPKQTHFRHYCHVMAQVVTLVLTGFGGHFSSFSKEAGGRGRVLGGKR